MPGSALRPDRTSSADAARELQRLEAEAHYHRDRLALYRARVMSARPTSPVRLRELEQTAEAASARLRDARDRISGTP
jgi:hypothetical protein